MSEVLARLEKKGGNLTETVLWTNPSPNSSFSPKDVSLSESLRNFKYIKICTKSSTGTSNTYEMLVEPDFLVSSTTTAYHPNVIIGTINNTTGYTFVRRITYVNDLKINIGTANTILASVSDNTYTIPTKIVGLK